MKNYPNCSQFVGFWEGEADTTAGLHQKTVLLITDFAKAWDDLTPSDSYVIRAVGAIFDPSSLKGVYASGVCTTNPSGVASMSAQAQVPDHQGGLTVADFYLEPMPDTEDLLMKFDEGEVHYKIVLKRGDLETKHRDLLASAMKNSL